LAEALLDPEEDFRRAIRGAAGRAGFDLAEVPIAFTPSAELGDLATPVCFELARRQRQNPRDLARRIADACEPVGVLRRVEPAGAGYLNGYLDRRAVLQRWLREGVAPAREPSGPKIIVEHTNINPNKAAHIGHLRNAVLGDTLVRCLVRLGRRVEVQNYIDDTGVQVADLVVGFRLLRGEGLDEVRERYSEQRLRERGERLDFVAWDLYAEVTRYYAEDPARHAHREETLQLMEQGGNPVAQLAAHLAQRMVQHHLGTMARIGVRYDLLPRESDILALSFWATAFERLRASGAIQLVAEGRHAGCWVMQLPGVQEGAGEDEKVIVRSNGTVTYVGKDIAYQLWKFGLLGRDFVYRRFDWSPRERLYELWSTCAEGGEAPPVAFGAAHTVYNVIDQRQSYLQRVVGQGLRALGHPEQAERSVHFAYEMVALTPAAVQTLFPEHVLSAEDARRPYVEMSGRRGLGIRADDLLDALVARAGDEVRRRHPELDPAEIARTAETIGLGAARYYMLRFSRNRVVAFDLDAALAFEGETGPYLQYSVVRAQNILAKVEQRFGPAETEPGHLVETAAFEALAPPAATDHWSVLLGLLRTDAVVREAVASLDLSTVGKHAYELAQAFNSFYHRYPVVQESDAAARAIRVAIVRAYHAGMIALLDLMGIGAPQRM